MDKFIPIFLFILSLLVIIKEIFRLSKSVNKRTEYDITPRNLLYLGFSISYSLTYLITL